MDQVSEILVSCREPLSPLVLSDRLLTLAKDADRAGFQIVAEHLLYLASDVLDGQMDQTASTKH